MSSTPKASDQPLPQLYHLEHDKVPSQLQQHVQIDSIDLNRPNNDHIKNRSINVIGIDLPELNETNTVSIDLPETCKESHTMIDSRDLEDKNIQEDLPPDEPSNVHLKSTIITKPPGTNKIAPDSIIAEAKTIEVASKASSETGSTVPELSQADDSSDLLLSSALECDEMYIDRSTSSIDLDAGIKSDSGALSAAIDDDCLSEKESPYSGDAVSEDRTSLNDLDGEFECDKDEDVEFDISSGAKVLSLDLVRQVIEKLRRCRSRTDKPRIVRILQKTCNLSRQKVVAFLTQAIDQNHIERFRYREYYGLRLVGSGGASGKDDGKEPGTPYDDKDDSLMGDSSGSGLLDTIMKLLHESLAEHKNGVDCDTILKILQDQPSTSGQVTLKQVKMLMQEQVEKKNGLVEEVSSGMYRMKQIPLKIKLSTKCVKSGLNKRKHSPVPDRSCILDDDASAEYIVNRISGNRKKDEIVQRARPVSQRKKIKKSLGPDFLDPTDLKYQYSKNSYEQKCEFCNLVGNSYSLVSCKKCKSNIHTRCLEKKNDKTALKRLKVNDCYLCENCRLRCASCLKDDLKLMAICKGCSDVFHLDCIPDALDCDTNGNWYCTKCTKDNLQLGPEGAPKMEPIKNETNLREISNRNEVISEISIKKEICDTPAIGASVSEHQQLIEETTTKESETSELEAEADDDADALMTAEDDPKSENLVSGNSDSESCEIIKLDSNVLTRASEIDMNENTNESSKDSTTIKIEPLEIKEEKIDDDEEVKEMVEPDQASDSNETNPPILDEDTSRSSSGSVNAGLAEGASNGQPTGTDYVDLVDEYRRLLPSYIRQYEINIDKEAIEKLKLLNSYSNGKNPLDWTVDDVQQFITEVGFPEESRLFYQEEIDGKSLLLLRRNDVLNGFSMRLGPALKIYAHIYKLQGSL